MKIKLIKLFLFFGVHGIRHEYAIKKLFVWMHNNGVGV